MSVYSIKGKGWRYDFTQDGVRHTEAWFKTKRQAAQAEAKRREEIENPETVAAQATPKAPERIVETREPQPTQETGITFLDLVNSRLDHVKAYNSFRYYEDHIYMARRWVKRWGKLECRRITQAMIKEFVLERRKVSAFTANKEIRSLRATFNYGIKEELISENPAAKIGFFPVEKRIKQVPTIEEIEKVIAVAEGEEKDYLIVLRDTMARVSEVNRLTWNDVDLEKRFVILYTRKKKGGHLTPRKVPMTKRLHSVLERRFTERDRSKPWVFWHRHWSKKKKDFIVGPYKDRSLLMKKLCKKAGVRYFRYHPIRHSGASILDNSNVPIGSIQRILGHENRTTTEIYLHTLDGSERAAIAVLERLCENSHTESHTDSHTAKKSPLEGDSKELASD